MVTRHEFANVPEERTFVADVAETQILRQQLFREYRGDGRVLEQGLDFGGEGKQPSIPVVVERLDAQTIARAEEAARFLVPDGERKHAAEEAHAIGSVLCVGMQDGFGITAGYVTMTGPLQVRTEVGVVEDFAVVYDPARAGLVGHGLMSRGQVDDAEPPHPDGAASVDVDSLVVGTAMTNDAGHAGEDRLGWLVRRGGDKTGNTAHIYPV